MKTVYLIIFLGLSFVGCKNKGEESSSPSKALIQAKDSALIPGNKKIKHGEESYPITYKLIKADFTVYSL